MRKGYCFANSTYGYDMNFSPYWVSCSYEQYLDKKNQGRAVMIVHYDKKGKVVKEEKYNLVSLY